MKNVALAALLMLGAFAGGCALFLSPMIVMDPMSFGNVGHLWFPFAGTTAFAVWVSHRLQIMRGWALAALWAAAILAGGALWVLFVKISFQGF